MTHQLASGLLGYTPDTLLDEVVDAFAAGDGAAVFGVVDKVIETGQDPRRFTEDLLRRLRDLVIVDAVPDAPATGLIDCSEDQGERLVAQAARFGSAELSRAADLVATGLTEMRGATAPRLLLELVCARVLLPGADHATDGVLARLDRLEKRIAITGTPSAAAPAPAPAVPAQDRPTASSAPHRGRAAAGDQPGGPPGAADRARRAARRRAGPPTPAAAAAGRRRAGRAAGAPEPAAAADPAPTPAAPPSRRRAPVAAPPRRRRASARPPVPPAPAGGLSLVDVRRLWPDIVDATKLRRRVTWMHLTQNCQVVAVEGRVLTLGFSNGGARDSFDNGGSAEIVRQAAIDVVGADWRIETIVDPGAKADPHAPRVASPAAPAAAPECRRPPAPASAAPAEPAAPTGRPAGRATSRPRRTPPARGRRRPARVAEGGAGSWRPPGPASSRPGRPATTGPVAIRATTRTPTRTPTTSTPTTRASTPPSCCAGSSAPASSTRSPTPDIPTDPTAREMSSR